MRNIIAFFRINEWYSDVFLWFLTIMMLTGVLIGVNFKVMVIFAAYHFFMMCYCYLINSYADLDQDMTAKKKNIFSKLSKKLRFYVVVGSSLVMILLPLIIFNGLLMLGIAYANLFLNAFYSLRPVRFKERGLISIGVASLVQGPIAYLLYALYLNAPVDIYGGFLIWIFLIEASDDLVHQISDYFNDKVAGVRTFTTEHGLKSSIRLNTYLLYAMVLVSVIYFLRGFYAGVIIMIILNAFSMEKFGHFKGVKHALARKIKDERDHIN